MIYRREGNRRKINWVEKRGVLAVVVKRSLSIRMVRRNVKYVNIVGHTEQKGKR